MLAMFCFCTLMLSNSFLPNCQFLFCQATQFCSAMLNIFARGGQGPPGPSPRNAYARHKATKHFWWTHLLGSKHGQDWEWWSIFDPGETVLSPHPRLMCLHLARPRCCGRGMRSIQEITLQQHRDRHRGQFKLGVRNIQFWHRHTIFADGAFSLLKV